MSIDTPSEPDEYTLEFNIDKVNSEPNTDKVPGCQQPLLAIPYMPVKRRLVEEYTG